MKTSARAFYLVCTITLASFVRAQGPLFGTLSGYNLVAFGGMSCANSDVQGRLAVRQNLALINYNVACNAQLETNPSLTDQCPGFGSWTCQTLANQGFSDGNVNYYGLVGGPCTGSESAGYCGYTASDSYVISLTNVQLSGGLAYGESNSDYLGESYISDCSVGDWSWQDYPIAFSSSLSYYNSLQTSLSQRATTGTVQNNGYGTLTFVPSGTADVEVFFVDGHVLSTTYTLNWQGTLKTGAYAVINVNGTAITLQGGNAQLKPLSANLVWNFYESTSINVDGYSIFGSVLAPNADVVGSNGVAWGQLFIRNFLSANSGSNFYSPSTCMQVNWVPFGGLTPPASTCGDGVVSGNEQCDNGNANGLPSSCCTTTCTFVPSPTVCRPVAGACDIAEMCSGTSGTCPPDTFLPSSTPCSHAYGICDLEVQYHCPGNGAQCIDSAPAPLFAWDAFNVISFNTYYCNGGDVQGALAVRNNGTLNSFDAGLLLSNSDIYTLFTVVSGGDLTWSSGEVHPNTGYPYPYNRTNGVLITAPEGYIGVGGKFNAPAYLQASLLPGAYITGAQFDAGQAYYEQIQSLLSALGTNAAATTVYGDGLLLTCTNSSADLYHVTVDASVLSTTNWYTTAGCQFTAAWIIDVTGPDDVTIKGGPFPGVVEKVVYNVIGSGRVIYGETGVTGNILAPQNTYTQSTGVTYGRLIAGNILEVRQNNKPNCINFEAVTISNVNLKPVSVGDQWVYVVNVGGYSVGDLVCSPSGECHKVTGATVYGSNKRQADGDQVLMISGSWSDSYPAGTVFSTSVDANTPRAQSIPVTYANPQSTTSWDTSSASVVASSMALLALLAVF